MNPLITALLSATGADRQIADYLASRDNRFVSSIGRGLGRVVDFDDRITRGAQDAATSLLGRLFGGSREGAPLPGWMEGNNLGPPRELGFAPTEGYTPPDFSGLMPRQGENNLYGQGQGMMRAPRQGQRSGVGVGGGRTIATGDAAQGMFAGMRNASQQQMMNEAQRAYQLRAQSIMK